MSQPVNLNLLPLLRALLKDRSVTQAAHSLGVSQSAASQGLGKLREMLDDPLLVRIGGRMQLTPRAKALATRVETVSAELDDMFLPNRFDPSRAERVFVIAADDYPASVVARPMLDLVRAEAPGVGLQFIEIGIDLTDRMASGEIDFALMPRFAVRDFTTAPLRYRHLFREVPGLLMDRAHPLAALSTISAADFAPFEHVAFRSDALDRIAFNRGEESVEVAALWHAMQKVVARTNHVTLIPALLQGTDRVAAVPYGVGAELSRKWPVVVRKLSFGPREVDIGLAWSPVLDADPAHTWFRTKIEAQTIEREQPG